MKLSHLLTIMAVSTTVWFTSCKPKDADIKAAIEAKIAATPEMSGAVVDVKDGVATISGMVKDDACKAMCEKEIAAMKDVKSVINNCTVPPPAPPPAVETPASTTAVLDAATQQKVKDGLKDIKGVTVEFVGEKAVLSGEVTKADRMKIMQMLAAANVKSDVTRLADKK